MTAAPDTVPDLCGFTLPIEALAEVNGACNRPFGHPGPFHGHDPERCYDAGCRPCLYRALTADRKVACFDCWQPPSNCTCGGAR